MKKQKKPAPSLNLSAVPLDVIAAELFRRECCAVIITPSDLSEYWESDESGATHPGSATPTPEEMKEVRRGFEQWLDAGNFTEIMQVCRDNWKRDKEGQTKEAPLPWNGITENTRDPLELDDDAPPHPSELGNPFETEADAPTPWAIELSNHPGEPVFWNNADGWGGAETADRFTDAEKQTLNLPIGGVWVRTDTDTETKEKATRQFSGWVECVQRGADWELNDLVAWVVGNLKPGAVKGLAADWDDSQANMKESGENE